MLIEKYTADWIRDFELLKFEIAKGLRGTEFQIEHVGSTAVPNLAAKAIIDINIIYEKATEFEAIKTGLINLGYFHNGDQGIAQREVFKRITSSNHKILDGIRHHLYVCQATSNELKRHILFRDFLRNNDWARIEYEAKKYELAMKARQDKKLYAELKELHLKDFINSIVEK
ncbi:GrpB family protein [Fulvivirgaceae bacterium LMO-SS25]